MRGTSVPKNGIQQLYESNDQIDLPRKKKDVQVYTNFFSRQCTSDVIPFANIDSVVVWNATSKKTYAHLFLWKMWDGAGYISTTHHCKSMIYASQGYSVTDMGGMKAWQGNTVAAMFSSQARRLATSMSDRLMASLYVWDIPIRNATNPLSENFATV